MNTIRTIRKSRKMTLQALADKVGTSPGFLHDIEDDRRQPSLDTLARIVTAFDEPVTIAGLVVSRAEE